MMAYRRAVVCIQYQKYSNQASNCMIMRNLWPLEHAFLGPTCIQRMLKMCITYSDKCRVTGQTSCVFLPYVILHVGSPDSISVIKVLV